MQIANISSKIQKRSSAQFATPSSRIVTSFWAITLTRGRMEQSIRTAGRRFSRKRCAYSRPQSKRVLGIRGARSFLSTGMQKVRGEEREPAVGKRRVVCRVRADGFGRVCRAVRATIGSSRCRQDLKYLTLQAAAYRELLITRSSLRTASIFGRA